jgi:hypothetical protein
MVPLHKPSPPVSAGYEYYFLIVVLIVRKPEVVIRDLFLFFALFSLVFFRFFSIGLIVFLRKFLMLILFLFLIIRAIGPVVLIRVILERTAVILTNGQALKHDRRTISARFNVFGLKLGQYPPLLCLSQRTL